MGSRHLARIQQAALSTSRHIAFAYLDQKRTQTRQYCAKAHTPGTYIPGVAEYVCGGLRAAYDGALDKVDSGDGKVT